MTGGWFGLYNLKMLFFNIDSCGQVVISSSLMSSKTVGLQQRRPLINDGILSGKEGSNDYVTTITNTDNGRGLKISK
jgi:hypothetical protein